MRDPVTEIETLCTDRREDGSEIFTPNAWYGAARGIRQYSGWPENRPLPIAMPHGIELSADFLWDGEINHVLPAIFSFPAYRDETYRVSTDKLVIPGFSPWLCVPRPQRVSNGDVVLLMPAHSSIGIDADMNHELFIRAARDRYPREDLRCCLYYRDIQLGRHDLYLEKDIPVVSAGHIFDPEFFERMAALFADVKLVVTNVLGSHVFYAASHEVPVTVLSEIGVQWKAPETTLSRYVSAGPVAKFFEDLMPLFHQPFPDIARQRPASELMLGAERMMSPRTLRERLDELWRTPGLRSYVVPQWRVSKRIAPARALLRRILG